MSSVHSSYVCSIIHESLTKGWLPVILLQFQEKLRISIMSTNLENCHNYSNILLGANSFSYFIISQVFSNYYVTIYFGCLSAQCNLGDHPSPVFSSASFLHTPHPTSPSKKLKQLHKMSLGGILRCFSWWWIPGIQSGWPQKKAPVGVGSFFQTDICNYSIQ